jgi:hypothetical protein
MATESFAKKPSYVAEIGFGDGKKIGRLASMHPDTVYIGFEVPRNVGKVDSLLPNLSLNNEGAFEGLMKLPNESVSSVIMDLVLEDDFTVTQWQWFRPGAGVNEVRESDMCDRARTLTQGVFDTWRKFCLFAVRKALRDDGELYIHTFQQDLNRVEKLLDTTEFTHESRRATEEETSESTYMRGIAAKVKEGDERFGEEATIYTIVAKKKIEQKKVELLQAPLE